MSWSFPPDHCSTVCFRSIFQVKQSTWLNYSIYSPSYNTAVRSAIERSKKTVVLKSILKKAIFKLLDQVTVELKEAQADYKNKQERCQQIASTDRPHPSLPLEIIQYIISLVYENAGSGRQKNYDMSLLFYKKNNTLTGNRLFASTTVDVEFLVRRAHGKFNAHTMLKITNPVNARITVEEDNSVKKKPDWIPAALRYAQRWKALKICGKYPFVVKQLVDCKAALFHTRSLEIEDWFDPKRSCRQHLDEEGVKTLDFSSSSAPKLQSAIMSAHFLVGLAPSGFLANIIDLEVHVHFGYQEPSFELYVILTSQLRKLISLSLRSRYCFIDPIFFSGSDNYSHLVTSLKSLRLKDFKWKIAESIISCFSSCDLNRFSIIGESEGPSVEELRFVSSLSCTFPHLQQLSINYVSHFFITDFIDAPVILYKFR